MTAVGFFIGAVIGWWLVLLCKSASFSSHHGDDEDYELPKDLKEGDLTVFGKKGWLDDLIAKEQKRIRDMEDA